MDNQLSIYTPSNTSPKILEEILVQRHKLLDRAVAWCTESVTTSKKNHILFIGPRGSGKTHMVSMIVNRLRKKEELEDKMLIVWLGEDDIVTNFLDLVLSILRYLAKEYGFSLECLEEAKGLKSDKVTAIMLECINEQLNGRKILLIKENLSDVFNGLKDMGQKQFRAYLQEQKNMVVLATSQQIFKAINSRDAVFFGFFDIHYLKPLSVDDAMELIEKVSAYKGDEVLRRFVKTAQGRYRVRALHHLAGGNQRLYMDLLSFLTKESLNDLVSALSKLADDLTPYFQERIKSLAPQQGLIVQKLCEIEGAISVKDLANEMFIGERSVAKQLGDLKEKGYVLAHKRGKLTYYEISEPLMRLSLQVKHTRGKPLKILVLLLRAWYSDDELKVYEKIKSDKVLKEYCQEAFIIDTTIIEKINHTANSELKKAIKAKDDNKVIEISSDIIVSPNTIEKKEKINAYMQRSTIYTKQKKYDLAIDDCNALLDIPVSVEYKNLYEAFLYLRAEVYYASSKYDLSIKDCKHILKNNRTDDFIKNITLNLYGNILYVNNDFTEAINIYEKYLELNDITEERKQNAIEKIADSYLELHQYDVALEQYLELINLDNLLLDKAELYLKIAEIFIEQNENEKILSYADKVLQIDEIDNGMRLLALYLKSIALANQQKFQESIDFALQYMSTLDEKDEMTLEILLLLSTVNYRLNKVKEARKYLIMWSEYSQQKEEENFLNLENLIRAIAVSQQTIWKTEIPFVLEIISKSQELEYLGKALIDSINYFINKVEGTIQFKIWQLLWEEIGSEYEYLQPSLNALKAARLAVEEKSDKPLFALPKETRELVLPMLEDTIKK